MLLRKNTFFLKNVYLKYVFDPFWYSRFPSGDSSKGTTLLENWFLLFWDPMQKFSDDQQFFKNIPSSLSVTTNVTQLIFCNVSHRKTKAVKSSHSLSYQQPLKLSLSTPQMQVIVVCYCCLLLSSAIVVCFCCWFCLFIGLLLAKFQCMHI